MSLSIEREKGPETGIIKGGRSRALAVNSAGFVNPQPRRHATCDAGAQHRVGQLGEMAGGGYGRRAPPSTSKRRMASRRRWSVCNSCWTSRAPPRASFPVKRLA